MRSIADSGRALEVTISRLRSWIPQWWKEERARAVTLGSDAHVPQTLDAGFPEAQHLLEQLGFRPGTNPDQMWMATVPHPGPRDRRWAS